MSKTILVTGAGGFIASHACEALLERGDTVVGIDNFNDYYDPERKRATVATLREKHSPERFRFAEGDIRDAALLERIFASDPIEGIAHFAAMAGVRASVEKPHLYYEVNLTGTLNLLEQARKNEVATFAFASTSSAYGRTERIPFVEDDVADRPLAPYPASKRAAELLGHAYHHLHGLNFTALRFFTVYGPRNRPDMMAHMVLDSMFSERVVPLYNGGDMSRDWTFVEDIVAGVIAAVDRPLGYEVINLGRGEPVHLNEFIEHLSTLTGKAPKLRNEPMPPADVPRTWADIKKAERLLGYAPKTSVAEGTRRLWEWYRSAVLG